MSEKRDIKTVDVARELKELGQPAFRARQVREWVFTHCAASFDEMTNLPAGLRQQLDERFVVRTVEIGERAESADGTRRYTLRLTDGNVVESVLIPMEKGWTACLSSQVGCRWRCAFCASGARGLVRNLTAGEILDEALLGQREALLGQHEALLGQREALLGQREALLGQREAFAMKEGSRGGLRNVVFMGIGEPLDNYDNVLAAVRTIIADDGLGIGARRVTISTCGVVPGIDRLAKEGLQVKLAVSLNAPDDERRSKLMPANRKWPLGALLDACQRYIEATKRRVTFEYVLIGGVNDGLDDARALARLLRGMLCAVNVLCLNVHEHQRYKSVPRRTAHAFRLALEEAGVRAMVRASRGADADAACGQLRLRARG
jgi:23S rRNA (adenine2503-C2)-methyltransferase